MRFRTTLFLAGLLALLSLTYYFLELREVKKEAETKLASFEEKNITGITIRRGKEVIALTKEEEGWRMSEPVEDRGDEKEIAALLGNLTRAKIERTLEAKGASVADFGLQDPPFVLTVHLKEKEEPFILEIGSDTPAGFSVYARRRGEDTILLAPATVRTSLDKKPLTFRSKVPLFFDRGAVKSLSLRTDSLGVRVEQQHKETWRITEPVQAQADAGKVSNLVRSLTEDQIQSFLDTHPASLRKVGLDPPRGEIRLTLEGGGEATLLLGARKKEGGVYAQRLGENRVLELKEEFFKALPKKVEDLRDRTLLTLDREKVRQIELKSPKGRTLLEKADTTWKLKEPEEASADHRLIEDLLWDLAGARVKEFVADHAESLKPYGLDDPAIVIRLLDQEGKPLATLALTRAPKREGAYVRVGDSQSISLVEGHLYDQFAKGHFDLRLRKLLSFETWDVGKVELLRNGQAFLIEKREEEWELTKPTRGKAKYAAVIDLLNELRDLKWQKLVAKETTDLARYGLDHPAATLTLTKTDDQPIGTLVLGKAEGDLLYAKLQEKPEIYGIPSAFLQSLPQEPGALAE